MLFLSIESQATIQFAYSFSYISILTAYFPNSNLIDVHFKLRIIASQFEILHILEILNNPFNC